LSDILDLKMAARPSTMMIAFFDAEGLVHHKFLPQHQTMTQTVYTTVLQRLRDEVRRKTASQIVFRYLASAPRQCAMPRGPDSQEILGQAQHPRGSPPAFLARFGPLRLLPLTQAEDRPEGETISRLAEIQLNTTRQLQAIPKQAYQTCTEKLKDRWNRCVQSGGSYFEGDNFE
jgi:hypothetical protein